MQFDAALVREQGIEFAIVIVQSHAVSNDAARDDAMVGFRTLFPGRPVVLMAQDSRGRPTYWGRSDIVRFLARVDPRRLPWRRFTR